MDSLGSHASEKVFISPSYVKGNFPGDRILGWYIFSFIAFKISLHRPLLAQFLAKICNDGLSFSTGKAFFPLAFFKIFSNFFLLLFPLCVSIWGVSIDQFSSSVFFVLAASSLLVTPGRHS